MNMAAIAVVDVQETEARWERDASRRSLAEEKEAKLREMHV